MNRHRIIPKSIYLLERVSEPNKTRYEHCIGVFDSLDSLTENLKTHASSYKGLVSGFGDNFLYLYQARRIQFGYIPNVSSIVSYWDMDGNFLDNQEVGPFAGKYFKSVN